MNEQVINPHPTKQAKVAPDQGVSKPYATLDMASHSIRSQSSMGKGVRLCADEKLLGMGKMLHKSCGIQAETPWRELYIDLQKELAATQRRCANQIDGITRAYEEKLEAERKESQKQAEVGYEQAYQIILDLQNRLKEAQNGPKNEVAG